MRRALPTLFAILLLIAPGLAAASYDEMVVEITATEQYPDFDAPWRYRSITTEQHMGVVVSGGHVLVSAQAVGYATLLEMSRFGESKKVPMKVSFVDYAAGLATLEPADGAPKDAMAGLKPVALADTARPGDEVLMLTRAGSEKVIARRATLREVIMRVAPTGGTFALPHYVFETAQPAGLGWSEAILVGGRLISIATDVSRQSVYGIATPVLRHFFKDRLEAGKYRGFVRLGISMSNLDSPDLRRYLKADRSKGGVYVTRVAASSPFQGKVEPGDVLLEVAGVAVSERGLYDHRRWGRVHFIARVSELYGGDEVSLKILRDGEIKTVKATVERYDPRDEFVPGLTYEPERHLIFGGMLFQSLSTGYLQSWGDNWVEKAPFTLAFLAELDGQRDPERGERVIFLNRVLADEHNKGYERLQNLIVERVNGMPIKTWADLEVALATPLMRGSEEVARIDFAFGGASAILGYRDLTAAHRRIARVYNVPLARSFFEPAPRTVEQHEGAGPKPTGS